MKSNITYSEVKTSGDLLEASASIEMTPEMFDLMSSKIYKDKPLAVIREILCNAKDAHVDAGVDQPIGLHVPNRLEPFLKFRDYGKGLSQQQVMSLYMKYGYSTKKETNDAIGCMGIGSKAPLAYTDSFHVISYQDGYKCTYNVFKDKGIPKVALLNTEMTTDPSGIEIKVAVAPQDFVTFKETAQKFLRFFDYPVTVTGGVLNYSVTKLIETPLYTTYQAKYLHSKSVYAVMGGIVYEVSSDLTAGLDKVMAEGERLHLIFDIGDISMAASRETLSEDEGTIKAIKKRVALIEQEYVKTMQGEIDKFKTPYELLTFLSKHKLISDGWGKKPNTVRGSYTWDGKDINNILQQADVKYRTVRKTHRVYDSKNPLEGFNEIPLFLDVDRGTGALKVASRLSELDNKARVILATNQAEIDELKAFFGDDIEFVSCKEKYPIMFPRGATDKTKVSVAKSGLYDINMREVKQLDSEETGYYIPYERDTCLIPRIHLGVYEMVDLLDMMNKNHKKVHNFYICRKGGLPAVKKTQLVEMDLPTLTKIFRGCYTKTEYDSFLSVKAYKGTCLLGGAPKNNLWPLIEDEFPLHKLAKSLTKTNKASGFLKSLRTRVIEMIIPDIYKDLSARKDMFEKEKLIYEERYPLVDFVSYYQVSPEILEELREHIKQKQEKNKVAKTGTVTTVKKNQPKLKKAT